MYSIKTEENLSINAKLLLNSDKESLGKLFVQHNVDPSSLDEMIRTIHDWYNKEPHLPKGQLNDQVIARLLVMRKFSIAKVKEKIDCYYSLRPKMEFLSNRDPLTPDVNLYLKNAYWIVLPRRTPENHRVTILRIKSSEGVNVLNLMKVFFMIADYRLWNDSVMGEQLILYYDNITLQLALQMTPVLISKILYYISTCLGPKVKGVHIINMPPFAETILMCFKKLLKPKVVQRIHCYKSFDEVLMQFPKNIFPKDFGGTDDTTCQDIVEAWENTLCSPAWRQYFIEQDSIYSDESKRILRGNSQNGNCFGVDGSFKKLCFD